MGKELPAQIVAMRTRTIERDNPTRERDVVYGYVNENGNEGPSGEPEGPGD